MNLPGEKIYCHHTGFKKRCRDLVTKGYCNRWVGFQGTNKNTGQDVNGYDCIDNWVPMLLIEHSSMQRGVGAAVESLRNEMVRMSESSFELIRASQQQRPLLDVTPRDHHDHS